MSHSPCAAGSQGRAEPPWGAAGDPSLARGPQAHSSEQHQAAPPKWAAGAMENHILEEPGRHLEMLLAQASSSSFGVKSFPLTPDPPQTPPEP